jgi:uncharacterized membrane protein
LRSAAPEQATVMPKRERMEDLSQLRPARRLWRLHRRLLVAIMLGVAVLLVTLAFPWRMPTRVLTAWDIAIAFYLAATFRNMASAAVSRIRWRAKVQDEGALALLVLTAASAIASLAAVVAELGAAPSASGGASWIEVALAMATILLSWAFMHTIFALHYAHEFYGEGRDTKVGGLIFPKTDEPDYWDFLYFSLVIAMTSQVSDVQICSRSIRRLGIIHGVISFFFNLTILALTVSMVSNLVQAAR